MKDENKTKKKLIEELAELRGHIKDLRAERTERKKAEKASQKNENKYQTLLEHLPQKIFLKDRNSVYISCNRNYARDLKIEPDEIVGKTDYDFYPKALAEKYRTDDKNIMKSEKTEEIEESYIQDGKKMIVHTVKTPFKDEKGNVVGILGVFWDISKRKRSEIELRKRTHDLRERVKELNCLYEISSLVEKPGILLEEILRGTVNLIPASWQYPELTCARIILEGQELKTENFKETAWNQSSDIIVNEESVGSVQVYYLEKKPLIDEGPFLNEERNLINAIAKRLGEIIKYKKAMDMLQTERDKFIGVLNALGGGVYIVNNKFVIEYQNETLKDFYPGGKGKKCYNYMILNEPCEHCRVNESITSGKVQQTEAILSDGGNYDIIYSPFTDVDGASKVIVLLRDITEKKLLEAETIRAGHLALLGELAAGVAHEINNPINGIINYAEMLNEQLFENNADAEIPMRIIKEGERIAQIVQHLLSFARDGDEEFYTVNIRNTVLDALSLIESLMVKDDITLNCDIPTDLPRVHANSQKIQQVFQNILSNARYALNQRFPAPHHDKVIEIKGEAIEIKGRKNVRISFYDRGTGISADILDYLCNPFFSTKPQGEGTGLGLSISHGIMKKHGGRLRFESVEGEFTNVLVELPADDNQKSMDLY